VSINNNTPHLIVLAEDDAVREVMLGFLLDVQVLEYQVKVLRPAGGWRKTFQQFVSNYQPTMNTFEHRHVLILIDCDGDVERIPRLMNDVDAAVRDRVFILGSRDEVEDLSRELRCDKETIGKRLARDCVEGNDECWNNTQLVHNSGEVRRLTVAVLPFLLQQAQH